MTPLIEWIHPSVRDVVIGYLIEHDWERQRFLRTTNVSGLILAVSTAGGSTGERTLPLLVNDDDWRALAERAAELIQSESSNSQLAMIQGLLTALTATSPAPSELFRTRLRSLAISTLEGVLGRWRKGQVVDLELLGSYYALSVIAGHVSPSPHLMPLWTKLWGEASLAIRNELEAPNDIEQLKQWANLTRLLSANEPRFLRIAGFPERHIKVLMAAIDHLETRVEDLESLYSEETEWVTMDDDHDVEAPVEPEPTEFHEIEWLESATSLIGRLTDVMPKEAERLERLETQIDEHLGTRNERKERYEEWEESLHEGPDDIGDWRGSERFDIEAFFSDL